MRTSGIHFHHSLAALRVGQRAAIYVGHHTPKTLLIQLPNGRKAFSVETPNGPNDQTRTHEWANDPSDQFRVLFDRTVQDV